MRSLQTNDELCAIYVDMGTTNTRAWLVRDSQVLGRASEPAGVRDTARDGSPKKIQTALRDLVITLKTEVRRSGHACVPACIAAAGMIGSPLGLAEVPHVMAPAGMKELASGARWFQFPEVSELPILLVPGIRTGPADAALDDIANVDVMRGEETLCAGLIALGLMKPPSVVLNLGSHWKAIRLGAEGRIESSITSLSGELIHAAQTQTILAGSVMKERATAIAEGWKNAGMKEQRRAGLARALFCVRLLELANQGTPEDRLSFLIGAFIASDMGALAAKRIFARDVPVVIAGYEALAEAWRGSLAEISVMATVLTAGQCEDALLGGLRCILSEVRVTDASVTGAGRKARI